MDPIIPYTQWIARVFSFLIWFWLIFMVNVGKYTVRPMDPLGFKKPPKNNKNANLFFIERSPARALNYETLSKNIG